MISLSYYCAVYPTHVNNNHINRMGMLPIYVAICDLLYYIHKLLQLNSNLWSIAIISFDGCFCNYFYFFLFMSSPWTFHFNCSVRTCIGCWPAFTVFHIIPDFPIRGIFHLYWTMNEKQGSSISFGKSKREAKRKEKIMLLFIDGE